MINEFDNLIKKASSCSKSGDYEVALEICSRLLDEYPERIKEILRARSHINAHRHHICEALEDRKKILNANEGDVQDYYFAGHFALQETLWRDAEKYFMDALSLLKEQNSCKYKQDSQFLLAYCLLKAGKESEAREICSKLDDSFEVWVETEPTGFLTVRNLKQMIDNKIEGAELD